MLKKNVHQRMLWIVRRLFSIILNYRKQSSETEFCFYLSIEDHKFAILGDSGIHNEVGIEFWQEIKEHSIKLFKENRFVEGLKDGITKAGEQLKNHFPYNQEDINEISDEISFGND